ncbi:hypothetical protein [Streptomyces barkulensis]|uniref:hypothetical protein n=1 Tax=Streptomyces barkulensis TaxID=1257026 RepID=UPI000C6EC7E6|nr:hypothetical protein [Streptomyces barkulensis]
MTPPSDHPVDRLLARAHLTPTAPYTPDDIQAALTRVAARVAARRADHPAPAAAGWPSSGAPVAETADTGGGHSAADQAAQAAARDLTVLCETVTARPDALEHLRIFLADRMPEPPGARVLGCLLYLAACTDSAQFWWQYAAGAEDTTATWCLYLHHLAQGEEGVADLWQLQADLPPATTSAEETEQEIATTLRVLHALKPHHGLPPAASALVAYVPAAVGIVDDDLELSLPDPDFTDRITTLAISGAPARPRPNHRTTPAQPLPTRRSAHRTLTSRTVPTGPEA